jgi:hypothetical protein
VPVRGPELLRLLVLSGRVAMPGLSLNAGWWSLAHVYRRPKEERGFHLCVVDDAPILPFVTYSHARNDVDVAASIKQSSWGSKDASFHLIRCRTCTATWTTIIGTAPPPNAELLSH